MAVLSGTDSAEQRTVTNFSASNCYRNEVHDIIPGGAHTYSKGDDQFPVLAPAAIERGCGAHVWDIDGNEYVDCSMGLGSVSLGHAYAPVLEAVREQLTKGVNFQRPASIELEFAREFVRAVPGADRVKFAKNGSTATSAAVKLARAFTGREYVAFPRNQPFFSYDDWFIGRTLCNNGVPIVTQALSLTYDSLRPETLEQLFHEYPGQIACVISEPEEAIPASPGLFQEIARLTRKHGAVLIADEMVTGYRAGWPGVSEKLGVVPDLSTWGKAIGNGFSFCALTGRADIMELGGIRQSSSRRVFLVSTTHGGEAHTIAAARAVFRTYQTQDVIGHHRRIVDRVARGLEAAVTMHGVSGKIEVHASPWRVVTVCRDQAGNVSAPFRTLLLQEMIGRGVLFQGIFLPCLTHTETDADRIVSAFETSCETYKAALNEGIANHLVGRPVRPVFRKYNGCEQLCPSDPCPYESRCAQLR